MHEDIPTTHDCVYAIVRILVSDEFHRNGGTWKLEP